MKKLLIGVAATAGLLAPGVASAETNAVIGARYISGDVESFDFDAYGLSGAFNHDFSNGWEVQMDGFSGRTDISGCCISTGYAAVHVGTRSENHSFGAFVGTQQLIIYSGVAVGIEGQMHFSNVTLNGSVGMADFGDLDTELTAATIDGTYFVTPNFGISAVVSHADIDDFDATGWGLGGEFRFSGPASIAINYRQTDFDSAELDTWTIGLNFDLGTGSLQERAQSGPSWHGARALSESLGSVPSL
jgi:opacity protein-like surface antigen